MHLRLAIVAAALVLAGLATVARAGTWLDGYAAYRAGDYKKALVAFQAAAAEGDGKAMNYLGQMYASGQGVGKDLPEAVRWFDQAARTGDAGGQNNLGEMYANGWGVPKSFETAAQWYQAAANSGDPTAEFNLGKMYAAGLGAPHKPDAAAKLFRQALKGDPKNDTIHNWLGAAYYDLGDYGSAVEQFKAFTQAGGRPADVWHYYEGMSLLGLDRLDAAQAAFQSGLNDLPTQNRGMDRRKEMRERLGAIERYKMHYQRATTYLASRELDQARTEFLAAQKAVRTAEVGEKLSALEAAGVARGPGTLLWWSAFVIPLAGIAGYVLHRRRNQEAHPAGASLVATHEDAVARAEALADGGDPEEGLRALEQTPKGSWGSREYLVALRLYRRLGRFDAAQALFADVRRKFTLDAAADLHYYFGLFCVRAGQVEKAKEIFRDLRAARGRYRDVETRLRGLEAMTEEEGDRVTLMMSTAAARRAQGESMRPQPAETGTGTALLIAGRFQITEPLGRGGMGYVYKAKDLKLPRDVALKKMTENIALDPAARARFLEEAKTIAQLNHQYIVVLHDVVESGGETYLVFEHVEGESLSEIIVARGRLPVPETTQLLRMVCHAMAFAHDRNVVHRDLKPSNIMKDFKGFAKVLDFGIALQMTAAVSAGVGGTGTPFYMAPEQHQGSVTYRSDIYSLGVTAYEMLAGVAPFEGNDFLERKLRGTFEPLPEAVPESLRRLVTACLKPEAKDRPQSMREVDAALKEVA